MSAVSGDQVELLEDLLIGLLPEGPPLYPEEQTTDEDTERQLAELIREAALEKVRQEVPHSLAVTDRGDHPAARPEAAGRRVRRDPRPAARRAATARSRCCSARAAQIIKAIGSEARVGMETLLGARVHLELHVTVLGEWQDDPKKLNRLGY